MFTAFFQSVNAHGGETYVHSSCVDMIETDAIKGKVVVLYADGAVYQYKNVSRRAIAKFNVDNARSMGKFINKVLKTDGVKVKQLAAADAYYAENARIIN